MWQSWGHPKETQLSYSADRKSLGEGKSVQLCYY